MADPFKNCTHHELITDAFCRSQKLFEKNNTCQIKPIEQICHLSTYSNPIGKSQDGCYEAFYTMCSVKNMQQHATDECVILEHSFVDWCTCEDVKTNSTNGSSQGYRDCVCFPYHANPYILHKAYDPKHTRSNCVCPTVFRKKCKLYDNGNLARRNITCNTTSDPLPLETHLNCSTWLQHHTNKNSTHPKVAYKDGDKWKVQNTRLGDFSTVLRNVSKLNFNITGENNTAINHEFDMIEFDLDHLLYEAMRPTNNTNHTDPLKPEHIIRYPFDPNATIYNKSLHATPGIPSTNAVYANPETQIASQFHSPLKTFAMFCVPFGSLLIILLGILIFVRWDNKKTKRAMETPRCAEDNWEDVLSNDETVHCTIENLERPQPSRSLHPFLASLRRTYRQVGSSVVVFKKDERDTDALVENESPAE